MNDIENPAQRALRAYELGSYCADFRYRFQLHALCTQNEAEHESIRDCGDLEDLLLRIHDRLTSLAVNTKEADSGPIGDSFQNSLVDSIDWLRCFFGYSDELSEEWQKIVTNYTALNEVSEEILEQDYDDAMETMEILIEENMPDFIVHAELQGRQLPVHLRSFFMLGKRLTHYCHNCWSIQRDLDSLSTRKYRYCSLFVEPVLEGLLAAVRECALLLPEANIQAPGQFDIRELHTSLENVNRDVLERLDALVSKPEIDEAKTPKSEIVERNVSQNIGSGEGQKALSRSVGSLTYDAKDSEWVVKYEGIEKRSKLVGFFYIREMVSRPKKSIASIELVRNYDCFAGSKRKGTEAEQLDAKHQLQNVRASTGTAGDNRDEPWRMADQPTIEAAKDRLAQINATLVDRRNRTHDQHEITRLEDEEEKLEEYLRGVTDKNGKIRLSDDVLKKSANRVRNAIGKVKSEFAQRFPELSHHFETSIKSDIKNAPGHFTYDSEVPWDTDRT